MDTNKVKVTFSLSLTNYALRQESVQGKGKFVSVLTKTYKVKINMFLYLTKHQVMKTYKVKVILSVLI
jgi:hypothetical protein